MCVFAAPQAGEDCPTLCTANYDPVCATDSTGKSHTFGNKCALTSYNCSNAKSKYFLRCLTFEFIN